MWRGLSLRNSRKSRLIAGSVWMEWVSLRCDEIVTAVRGRGGGHAPSSHRVRQSPLECGDGEF